MPGAIPIKEALFVSTSAFWSFFNEARKRNKPVTSMRRLTTKGWPSNDLKNCLPAKPIISVGIPESTNQCDIQKCSPVSCHNSCEHGEYFLTEIGPGPRSSLL